MSNAAKLGKKLCIILQPIAKTVKLVKPSKIIFPKSACSIHIYKITLASDLFNTLTQFKTIGRYNAKLARIVKEIGDTYWVTVTTCISLLLKLFTFSGVAKDLHHQTEYSAQLYSV